MHYMSGYFNYPLRLVIVNLDIFQDYYGSFSKFFTRA